MIEINTHKIFQHKGEQREFHFKFSAPEYKIIALYGPSGAGKSTLLRMIAGLERPNAGQIKIGSAVWFDSRTRTNLKPQQRSIAMVFHEPSLFPSMTVQKNINYANPENKKLAKQLIDLMHLGPMLNRKPESLSGGEQQRVALARALVRQPQVLLMDEPLSAIDSEMRELLQDEIIELTRQQDITTILVSHDKREVEKMADVVIKVRDGKVQEVV